MLRDDELSKVFVRDAKMVLEFGGDLGDEREELEGFEVVHCAGGR